jgi:acyl-CoA synthetase (AMP-forming)/AMP-acid ligase II
MKRRKLNWFHCLTELSSASRLANIHIPACLHCLNPTLDTYLLLHLCPKKVVFIAAGEMQEVVLGVLPFFHVYGLSSILVSSLYFGAKVVTLPQFKPDVYLNTLVKHKASIVFTLPPRPTYCRDNFFFGYHGLGLLVCSNSEVPYLRVYKPHLDFFRSRIWK